MTVSAQLIGYPRIGRGRELKWALERRWAGRSTPEEFAAQVSDLRSAHLGEQRELVGSAVDDFFLYDEVLETAMMFGAGAGSDTDDGGDPFGRLTALARGTPQREAWEMTKWFDTNYHFVVPEVAALPERVEPLPWREPTAAADVIWPILGPYSLAQLSKIGGGLNRTDVARSAGAALW